jgi:long-chain acyl-CoA synthetase
MQKVEKIFDLLDNYKNSFAHKDIVGYKANGVWNTIQIDDYINTITKLSLGLIQMGVGYADGSIEKRTKVAILSANRPEWLICDFATQFAGGIFVPIYPTSGENDIEFIFNHAEIKYVFTGDIDLYEKVKTIVPNTPSVQGVFCFDKVANVPHWEEIFEKGNASDKSIIEQIKSQTKKEDLATIIYTSGTTGTPKGVMLSHWNIMSNVHNSIKSFPFRMGNGSKLLSFLPLNHIFERMVSCIYLTNGYTIYYAESLEKIGDNLREVQPSGFTTVPRLLEKVYEAIMNKGEALKGVKKKLFDWAVRVGSQYDNNISGGFLYNIKLAIANKLIFSKWRQGLGGNIEFIITGSAACQVRLLRIFNAANIPIYEGYGPTENSPVISVNRCSKGGSKYGTVGLVIEGQEVRLEPDGEICVKGPSVMMGYYKREDLTNETIMNGWLHTGDIGTFETLNGNQFLKITDRKKELFKTSGGKYVAPQPIENKMKESKYIEQMMVVGADEKFTGALIVPNFNNVKAWCVQKNITETEPSALIRLPEIEQLFEDVVNSFNGAFNPVERIKKFELLPHEWTVNTGELTPTLKLKRKVILEKYKDAIQKIYA